MLMTSVRIQPVDVSNKNGRIYSRSTLEKVIADFDPNRHGFGSIGMNNLPGTGTDLRNVSHKVVALRIEDDYLVADIKLLETPTGKRLDMLMSADVIDFRMAGAGRLTERASLTGAWYIDDYTLDSINAVVGGA